MFVIFGRLTRDEEMPRIEELRHRVEVMLLRFRLVLAPVGRRAGGAFRRIGARRQAAVFFPIALVLMTLTIVLVARFGGTTRCSTATPVATAKPHPPSKPVPKTRLCRPALMTPLLMGR